MPLATNRLYFLHIRYVTLSTVIINSGATGYKREKIGTLKSHGNFTH